MRINTLPARGTLLREGVPVQAGAVISSSDLVRGKLTFQAAQDESGAAYTSFQFQVSDGTSFSVGSSTMTIDVADVQAYVRFRLRAFDESGQPLTQVTVGQPFNVRVLIQDLRPGGRGVFAAYLDLQYSSGLVIPLGPAGFNEPYSYFTRSGTAEPGRISNLGAGSASMNPLGPAEQLLTAVPFVAFQPGEVMFQGSSADEQAFYQALVYQSDARFPPNGSTSSARP